MGRISRLKDTSAERLMKAPMLTKWQAIDFIVKLLTESQFYILSIFISESTPDICLTSDGISKMELCLGGVWGPPANCPKGSRT